MIIITLISDDIFLVTVRYYDHYYFTFFNQLHFFLLKHIAFV